MWGDMQIPMYSESVEENILFGYNIYCWYRDLLPALSPVDLQQTEWQCGQLGEMSSTDRANNGSYPPHYQTG